MARADECHRARRRTESARIAEFGGDRRRGEIVDPTKAAQPLDPGSQRLEGQQSPQIVFHRAQPHDRFVDVRRDALWGCSRGSGHVCARSHVS
jgi:hypothetical protein